MNSLDYSLSSMFDRTENNSIRKKSRVRHVLETFDIEMSLDSVVARILELKKYYEEKGYADLFFEISYDDSERGRIQLRGWAPETDQDFAERLKQLDQWQEQVTKREEAEFERLKKKLGK